MSGQESNPESCCLMQGYMKKLKRIEHHHWFLSKFTKRWFALDFTVNKFYYTKCRKSSKMLEMIDFQDIKNINLKPKTQFTCSWPYMFTLDTPDRVFCLYCFSYQDYTAWAKCFVRVVRENNQDIHLSVSAAENDIEETERLGIDVFLCESPVHRPISHRKFDSDMNQNESKKKHFKKTLLSMRKSPAFSHNS